MSAPRRRIPATCQDLGQDICGNDADLYECVIHYVLHVDGRLDDELMREAVRNLAASVPIIKSHFVPTAFGAAFETVPELQDADLFAVVPAASMTLLSPLTQRAQLAGVMVAVRIYRGAQDTLAFFVDHRLCDGRGVVELVSRVLTVYAALKERRDIPPWPRIECSRAMPLPLRHAARGLLNDICRTATNRSQREFPRIGNDRTRPAYAAARISGDFLAAARRYAKTRGATLSELLAAALLRSYSRHVELPDEGPHRCHVVVDQRRHLRAQKLHPLANASAMSYVTVRGALGSFDETLAQLQASLAPQKESELFGFADWFLGTLLLSILPRRLVSAMVRRTLRTKNGRNVLLPALSNLGVLSFEGAQSIALRKVEVYPPVRHGPPVVAVYSFADCLTLVCGYSQGCYAQSRMQAFLDDMVAELRSATAEAAQPSGARQLRISP